MKKFIVLILVACSAYYGYEHFNKVKLTANDTIVLYSLSYCGFCKDLSTKLDNSEISFVEYYVDKDTTKKDELTQKLKENKVRRVKMPVVDLGEKILTDRPSLSDIRSYFE